MSDFTHCSVQKSNLEQIDHVTLYKREKWANPSRHSLKRAMWVTQANHSQKTSYSIEKIHIFICFSLLFPFYAQERIAPVPLCSVGLFWRGMEAIHSCRYLQKRDLELIAPVTLYKRVTVSDFLLLLFPKKPQDQFTLFQEWSALSLTKNKRFAWKTKKANSQPWT